MTIPSRPIGQDPQSQLLWNISKQLERLIQIMGQLLPDATTTTTTTSTSTTSTSSTSTSTTSSTSSTSSTSTTTTTAVPIDLKTSAVSVWEFNSNYNDAVSGHTLTPNGGISLGAGEVTLDGVTGTYLDAGTSNDFDIIGNYSISMWVNISSLGTGTPYLIYRPNSTDDGSQYGINYKYSDSYFRELNYDLVPSNSALYSATQDTYVHVVATYNGTDVKLYLAASLETTTPVTGSIVSYPGAHLSLGAVAQYGSGLTGKFKQIAIWDRELSAAEITLLNNSGTPLPYASW